MRTSGRTSRTSWPSARTISTCCHDETSDAVTWRTRGSLARSQASISCSSFALASKLGEPVGFSSP